MSSISLFLRVTKPFAKLIPVIEKPNRKILFHEKCFWTIISLIIFLICCQIPIYGTIKSTDADPLHWLRVVMASNRGTLMELGIAPIVTSSMIIQVLANSNLININTNDKYQQSLFISSQKLLGILMTLIESIMYVYSGIYGSIQELGYGNAILIILQLYFAGLIVLLLDEFLQKGYGIGSGISLFIATNICENIIWKAISPTTISTDRGIEFEGALVELIYLIITRGLNKSTLITAFYRNNLPNIRNLCGTIIVFLVAIYLNEIRIDLPIKSNKIRGIYASYPIKLLYTSNFPIILQSALVSNLHAISQKLHERYKHHFMVFLLGRWEISESGIYYPVSGFSYYLSPPESLEKIIYDPAHFIIYVSFVLISCSLFSVAWIDISGASPRDIAKSFKAQNITIRGTKENGNVKTLKNYIPIAAAIGGACIGALTIFANFMGAIGSGAGILMSVSIIFQYYSNYKKEKKEFMR